MSDQGKVEKRLFTDICYTGQYIDYAWYRHPISNNVKKKKLIEILIWVLITLLLANMYFTGYIYVIQLY
jgi:hypothetical protein